MSCLALSELSLSEQVAVGTAWADVLARRGRLALTALDPSAHAAVTPWTTPDHPGADGSIPSPAPENAACTR